jgi:hypothetical protein
LFGELLNSSYASSNIGSDPVESLPTRIQANSCFLTAPEAAVGVIVMIFGAPSSVDLLQMKCDRGLFRGR